jgi:hypothetical protein
VWHETVILDEIDRMRQLVLPHLDPEVHEEFEAAVERNRAFVSARREQIMEALVPEPPPWDEPLRDPLCFRIAGDLSGTFETTWGPLDRDALQEGSGSLEMTYDGNEPIFRQVGALVGPGENPERSASFAMVAVTWDGKIIVIWIETDPALIVPGATIGIGESPTVGFLLYIDPDVSPEPQLLGILGDGEIHFDNADTTDGGVVSGTIDSLIYGLFF